MFFQAELLILSCVAYQTDEFGLLLCRRARVRQEEEAAEEAARELEGENKAFRVGETDSEEEQKGGAYTKKGRGKR